MKTNKDEIDLQLNVIEKNTGQANLSMGYNGINGFTHFSYSIFFHTIKHKISISESL